MLWLILAAAGFGAGVINAVAGGGSLISFPALLLTGMSPVTANATNTVAVWPGTVSAAWAYRDLIQEERKRAWILATPSMLGGFLGSFILLHSSAQTFRSVVPGLIVFACALLALQEPIARWFARRAGVVQATVPWQLWCVQLLISVYGGYFGAGIGILMLATMAIALPSSLQHANALKVLLALLINGIASIYFLAVGAAQLPQAALMAVSSLAGGYAGASLAQRLPASILRGVVIAYGLALAARLYMTG